MRAAASSPRLASSAGKGGIVTAEETGKRRWFTPVRVNLLVIALLIAILNGGIGYLVYLAITTKERSEFVAGVLVGLLPVEITALSSLGTTLMNDK